MTTINKPFFAVFEGIDYSGKSTIGEEFAKKTGAIWLKTPSEGFAEIRKQIDDKYKEDGASTQLFYASTVRYASSEVRKHLEQGRSVVLDRYVASTIAYDTITRNSGISDDIWVNEIFHGVTKPDITFYLDVSDSIRARRAKNRTEKGATDDVSFSKKNELQNRYNDIFMLLQNRLWKTHNIRNDSTPMVCVSKCLEELSKTQR